MTKFTHISLSEMKRIRAMAKARKDKRAGKRLELASGSTPPHGPAASQDAPGRAKRSKKHPSARRRAFNRLKELCKTFVLMRNAKLRNGMCEIAMACGGENVANTWYHGWPQKGGNGLKYDARSHFASCGPCNMGEYGARMNGSNMYVNRHKELLGALWAELNALHGRLQISTKEAIELGDKYSWRIEQGIWL